MKTVIAVVSVLACVFSLDAQITATLNPGPDGSIEIRMRNNSALSLAAFAIRVKYVTGSSANYDPLMVYVDPAIDKFAAISGYAKQSARGPLLPNQEFTVLPERMVVMSRKSGKPLFEQPPASAGIFADGTTTDDAVLLTQLMLRRSNMLLAVETTLENAVRCWQTQHTASSVDRTV